MSIVTNSDLEKIKILDTLFASLNVDDLRELAEKEEIIARLKGADSSVGVISSLVNEHQHLTHESMNLRIEIEALRSNLQELIRVLDKTVFSPPNNYEFYNLKSRLGAY